MQNLCIAVLLFTLGCPVAMAEDSAATQEAAEAGDRLTESDLQEQYLRKRLDSAERYQEDLLGTMEWVVGTSFGIVLTITAVVVGLGWYTNFRLYRGDLEQIRQEQERKYIDKVDALRDEVAQNIEEKIANGLKEAKTEATRSAKSSVKSAISEIRELQLKMMHMEAKDWEHRGVDANALRTLALAMPLALEVGGQLEVDQVAEEMERILKNDKALMDGSLAQDLIDSLTSIKEPFPILFESLSARIRKSVGL